SAALLALSTIFLAHASTVRSDEPTETEKKLARELGSLKKENEALRNSLEVQRREIEAMKKAFEEKIRDHDLLKMELEKKTLRIVEAQQKEVNDLRKQVAEQRRLTDLMKEESQLERARAAVKAQMAELNARNKARAVLDLMLRKVGEDKLDDPKV